MVVIMQRKHGERQSVATTKETVKEARKWIEENKNDEVSYYYIKVDYHHVVSVDLEIEDFDNNEEDFYYRYVPHITGSKIEFTGTLEECEWYKSTTYGNRYCIIV